ncbi:hypothetical protein G7Z17_g7661 [Cylindrodendrum hubeiense]|uniref:Uncharacterized protein n=1 Tax=Cylindrodendrum hubeiense TaxID=595255 RepID=A0A9P5LE05_9HYPO|nr:hypothetical protein G7Z17_g7661 [Cylindrodendrum hubeiense]
MPIEMCTHLVDVVFCTSRVLPRTIMEDRQQRTRDLMRAGTDWRLETGDWRLDTTAAACAGHGHGELSEPGPSGGEGRRGGGPGRLGRTWTHSWTDAQLDAQLDAAEADLDSRAWRTNGECPQGFDLAPPLQRPRPSRSGASTSTTKGRANRRAVQSSHGAAGMSDLAKIERVGVGWGPELGAFWCLLVHFGAAVVIVAGISFWMDVTGDSMSPYAGWLVSAVALAAATS